MDYLKETSTIKFKVASEKQLLNSYSKYTSAKTATSYWPNLPRNGVICHQ